MLQVIGGCSRAVSSCDAEGKEGSGCSRRCCVCCLQAAAVSEVEDIWGCKRSVAKTLLMHYMWDKEKLLGKA